MHPGSRVHPFPVTNALKKGEGNPAEIIIVTSDLALCCDTSRAEQQRCMDQFCQSLLPFFASSVLSQVRLVVARTTVVLLDQNPGSSVLESDRLDIPAGCEEDQAEHTTASAEDNSGGREPDREVGSTTNQIIQCLQQSLEEWVTTETARALASPTGFTPDISITTMDHNSHGFQLLARQWTRDTLASTGNNDKNRIKIELPETTQGIGCTISLDMAYQILPFPILSAHCKKMMFDLQLLAACEVKLLQLVPMASLDASMLFGIPIQVQAALEQDYDSFVEMKNLVQSLLYILAARDSAMLLQCTNENKTPSEPSEGLFHSENQVLVLMPQELPDSMQGFPTTGLLYRYAQQHQVLGESSSPGVKVDFDTRKFVEDAVDVLECGAVNPLCI
jgi:hypothetical protein